MPLPIHALPAESGAEATAVQTLRAGGVFSNVAERLDCGAFTARTNQTGGHYFQTA